MFFAYKSQQQSSFSISDENYCFVNPNKTLYINKLIICFLYN